MWKKIATNWTTNARQKNGKTKDSLSDSNKNKAFYIWIIMAWVITSNSNTQNIQTLWKKTMFYNFQLNFWVAKNTCNLLYLYAMNVNEQVAWVVELQFTSYIVQLITTQLQFNQNNSFSTIIQFHCNCTHDVMLMSLIVINLLKSNTWCYEKF
jgi:hypothetical protein